MSWSERYVKFLVFTVAVIGLLAACLRNLNNKPIVFEQNDFRVVLPAGFDTLPVPLNNEMTLARVELGKKLFFDPVMSLDSTISCASCHNPDLYFTDAKPKSVGIGGQVVDRNAPTLYNVAYHPYFLREGGVPTLEMQVLVPIQEHREFNYNIVDLSYRLREDSNYVSMANEAYNREIDPFVITRALSAYERTLISGNSAFDQYYYGGEKDAISDDAKKGYKLFTGNRLKCSECHSGFNFTNYAIVNTGLYTEYKDPGKARLTLQQKDSACFKVPSLRNVSKTAPYMHDGSLETLNDVLNHYASGGKPHPNKSPLITGFELTEKERQQVLAFLESLTDIGVLQNQH